MNCNNILTRDEVLLKLYESYDFGNLGLFIGAGFSRAVVSNIFEVNEALGWEDLLIEASKNLNIDYPTEKELKGKSSPEIASYICECISRRDNISYSLAKKRFKIIISQLTSWLPSKEKISAFKEFFHTINPSWIITTNYDEVLERLSTAV